MGDARRARLAAAKRNLKLLKGGLVTSGEIDENWQNRSPAPRLVDLHILVPKDMEVAINEIHAIVSKQIPMRNDFLVSLLAEGVNTTQKFIESERARAKAMKEQWTPTPPTEEPTNGEG